MKKLWFLLVCALTLDAAAQQVVINEVDADQAGSDAAEFIELYGTPNMSLNGYVVVLFNGANDQSYNAFDLDGYSLDANGFFVMGNPGVPGVALTIAPGASGAIQNGADAVALYQANATDWPNGTAVGNANLIDALVYGTADAADAELIAALLPGESILDEGVASSTVANMSSSRVPDGGAALDVSSYVAQAPTPGASNGGDIMGCMDVNGCNYNASATIDNGSCTYPGDPCDDANANTTNDAYNGDCVCSGDLLGCTDVAACNYNAAAMMDDNSCAYPGDGCDDGDINTADDMFDASCVCMGLPAGCTDAAACNFDPTAQLDNGNCWFIGGACDDQNPNTINDAVDADCNCLGEANPTSTVLIAQGSAVGSTVTVTGVITNGIEMGSTVRYLQDNGGGIAIYPGTAWTTFTAPNRGDLVTITGVLTSYSGLLEVGPTINSITTLSTNQALPIPQLVTPAQLGESLEGELVMVENVVFDLAGSAITGNSTYSFTANGETGAIYIRNGSVLVGTNLPSSAITMVGITSQYDPTAPYDAGYQILPRDADDFILPPGVAILGTVVQENIQTTSFDLTWQTNNPGNSQVNYGLTPALGEVITVSESVTDHTVNIPGLLPGTIYYASVTSTNADGSSTSTVRPYATKSESSGEIRVYFNRSVDTTWATTENAITIGAGSNDSIAAYISRAQQSVDIAIYNFTDDAVIANAINARYDAGVQVRIISDGSTAQLGLSLLNPSIPVVERFNTSGTGIMHNKFIIIDPDDVDNAWVWTGSMNWTDNNMYNDFNNIIIFQDQSLARGYRLEFEEIWGGSGAQPGVPSGVFGAAKSNNTPLQYVIGPNNIMVESYFSPTDNANGAIIKTMQTTDANLDYAVLAFTRQDIADAIIAEDDLFLVLVRGIIEQTSDPASEYTYLQTAGQDVQSHEGISYDMHHKYLIVDHSTLDSDPTVLTGSHNWSSAAQTTNDENTVVVHDARVANLFLQEFMARWGQTNSVAELQNADMSVYPNPAPYQVMIGLPKGEVNAKLEIFDMKGQLVLTSNVNEGVNYVTLNNVAAGTYICKVQGKHRTWNKTLVVR